MTKKKTGQHYIPNTSYLSNFADDSGKVWVLDAADKIYSTNPFNIFKEQHFYTIKLAGGGGSLIVEDTLANIEGTFATIYREKISQSKALTLNEKAEVAVFLAALHLRTKRHREGLRGALDQLLSGMKDWKKQFETLPESQRRVHAATPSSHNGESMNMEDIERALANVDDIHSTTMIDNLPEMAQLIFDMDWQYLPAPESEVFVTSEDPFRVLRPEAMKKYGANAFGSIAGLGWADAEFTLPLSSTLALYGVRKGVGDGILKIDKRQLDQINYRTIMYANEKVVACKPDVLEEIKRTLVR